MRSERDKLIYKQKRIEQIQKKYKTKRKQKKRKRKRPSRCFSRFIHKISPLYQLLSSLVDNNQSKNYNNIQSIINPETLKLPLWRDVSPTQRLAFYFHCLARFHTDIVPFTLNVSHFFRDTSLYRFH